MMNFLLIIVFVGLLVWNSSERTISDDEDRMSSMQESTTTSWWTRTFPISETRTARIRSRPSMRATTAPVRISRSIMIIVPVVLFSLTILFGFGLIFFAYITNGNGVSFLTRTDAHRLRQNVHLQRD